MGVLGELLVKDTGLGQGKKREKTPEAQHRDRGGGGAAGGKERARYRGAAGGQGWEGFIRKRV